MIIYGAVLMALIAAFILWRKFKKQVVWWEYLFLLIPIPLVLGIKLMVKDAQITFTEYWGSQITEIYEAEPWNKWVEKTCSERYVCGFDEDGFTDYCTNYYPCPYQDDVGPSWSCKTSSKEGFGITEYQYDKWLKLFGGERSIVKTRKNHSSSSRCANSSKTKFKGQTVGNKSYEYKTPWNKAYFSSIPVTTTHSYKNRIKASDLSQFDMEKISDEEAAKIGLYSYPEMNNKFNYPTVLGIDDKGVQEIFQKINGEIGPKKHARLWVLVHYTPDKTIGEKQEFYWARGNQNEIVVNIGVDEGKNIIWSHVFSWMEADKDEERPKLFTEIEKYIFSLDVLDKERLVRLSLYLKSEILTKFEINKIEEFDRVTVDPPAWATILCYILSAIIIMVVSLIVVKNDVTNE